MLYNILLNQILERIGILHGKIDTFDQLERLLFNLLLS